ncbi:hypothetical protein EDB82DRAFT_552196 [Fusarium venenatum]|uniref:uncharacterized protein n=1 Tax=Fusarium venenatum TaxID=56646 RepID=UPI001D3079AA|nr:hypothetical protein EDB82DRAFT_552196 [Fusarium venenatum]
MVELRYLRLDIKCLPAESMGRLAELIHSYRREFMASKGMPLQHCALYISASAEVTLAFLAIYNPSQFKSLHCDAKELMLPEERSIEPGDTISRLYSDQYRNIIKMQNLERLCICFSPDEQDEKDEQEESISGMTTETTFREIREITSNFPRLEWLIIHDNTAFIQDYMEVVGFGTVYHGQQFDRIYNCLQSRTNLTHLAFTIHSHRMSLQLRIHNLLDEDEPIGNQTTRLYFQLARRLIAANPQLQHVVLMDEWPYHYSARKDDLGVIRSDKN